MPSCSKQAKLRRSLEQVNCRYRHSGRKRPKLLHNTQFPVYCNKPSKVIRRSLYLGTVLLDCYTVHFLGSNQNFRRTHGFRIQTEATLSFFSCKNTGCPNQRTSSRLGKLGFQLVVLFCLSVRDRVIKFRLAERLSSEPLRFPSSLKAKAEKVEYFIQVTASFFHSSYLCTPTFQCSIICVL